MRELLADCLYWIDHKAPPWLNLILTAGFHSALTAAAGYFGFSAHMAVAYTMKEAGPFLTAKATGAQWPPERPGWSKGWVIADSVADMLGPWIVHLLYVL